MGVPVVGVPVVGALVGVWVGACRDIIHTQHVLKHTREFTVELAVVSVGRCLLCCTAATQPHSRGLLGRRANLQRHGQARAGVGTLVGESVGACTGRSSRVSGRGGRGATAADARSRAHAHAAHLRGGLCWRFRRRGPRGIARRRLRTRGYSACSPIQRTRRYSQDQHSESPVNSCEFPGTEYSPSQLSAGTSRWCRLRDSSGFTPYQRIRRWL